MITQHGDVRRNVQGVKTRQEVLRAAGRLFATRGYGQTSVRDLARASGAGLSTIIYHFKSKENLYIETIRHFAQEVVRLNSHFEPLSAVDVSRPQEVSDALLATIHSFLAACHERQEGRHVVGFYMRLLVDGNQQALKMLHGCFSEVDVWLGEFFSRVRPDFDQDQISAMRQLLWSQLQYTVSAKPLILMDLDAEEYSAEHLEQMAWDFASHCCLPLALPAPQRRRQSAAGQGPSVAN